MKRKIVAATGSEKTEPCMNEIVITGTICKVLLTMRGGI